jgi:tetratricopeptide (TPR) repeat protein
MFQQFFDIPKMNMFEGEDIAANDTAYAVYRYYAGLALSRFADTDRVIAFFEGLKDNNGYNEDDIFKYLTSLYEQVGDTVNLIRTLSEGVERFPNESFYMLSLINQYIFSNQGEAAIEMLQRAIAVTPDKAELYNVLGFVYENSKNDLEAARANYEKAISLDPGYVEAIGNLGRLYFNRAVEAQVAANEITDNRKYQEARAQANEMFKEALPFFEKAHQMNPEEREYMIALSRIYYVLGDKRYDEIEKKLNQ